MLRRLGALGDDSLGCCCCFLELAREDVLELARVLCIFSRLGGQVPCPVMAMVFAITLWHCAFIGNRRVVLGSFIGYYDVDYTLF